MLVEMATGTGKTRTAAAFIKRLFEVNAITRVLFLVDRIPLAKPTRRISATTKTSSPSATRCAFSRSRRRPDTPYSIRKQHGWHAHAADCAGERQRSRIGGADLQRAARAAGKTTPPVDLGSDAAGPPFTRAKPFDPRQRGRSRSDQANFAARRKKCCAGSEGAGTMHREESA